MMSILGLTDQMSGWNGTSLSEGDWLLLCPRCSSLASRTRAPAEDTTGYLEKIPCLVSTLEKPRRGEKEKSEMPGAAGQEGHAHDGFRSVCQALPEEGNMVVCLHTPPPIPESLFLSL